MPKIMVRTSNNLQSLLLPQMRGANRQRHGQAADDQHGGVRRAERRDSCSVLVLANASGYMLRYTV